MKQNMFSCPMGLQQDENKRFNGSWDDKVIL